MPAGEIASGIRCHGAIAYVSLTRGYVATVDACDVPLVGGYNWRALVKSTSVYAISRGKADDERQIVSMHGLILPAPAGKEVDHRDGDGLHNRRSNLRLATRRQQTLNRSSNRAGKTSRYPGISWHATRSRWRAKITVDGKDRHIGLFKDETLAFRVYVTVARAAYGEFFREPAEPAEPLSLDEIRALPRVARELCLSALGTQVDNVADMFAKGRAHQCKPTCDDPSASLPFLNGAGR